MSQKPREWTINDGDSDGRVWDGPQVSEPTRVIEYSAYKKLIKLIDIADDLIATVSSEWHESQWEDALKEAGYEP